MPINYKIFPLLASAILLMALAFPGQSLAQPDSARIKIPPDSLLAVTAKSNTPGLAENSTTLAGKIKEQIKTIANLSGEKAVITDLSKRLLIGQKQGWLRAGATAVETGGNWTGNTIGNNAGWTNRIALQAKMMAAGIPLSLAWVDVGQTGFAAVGSNLPIVKFDRQQYLETIREKIKKKLSGHYLEELAKSQARLIKSGLLNDLTHSVDSIYQLYGDLLQNKTRFLKKEEWLQADLKSLANRLLPASLITAAEHAGAMLALMQQQALNGIPCSSRVLDSLRVLAASVTDIRCRLDHIQKIQELYKAGLKQINAPNIDSLTETILQNPAALGNFISNNLGQSLFQRFLSKLNQFSIGHTGAELSSLTLHQFIGNGINISYAGQKTFLFLRASVQSSLNPYWNNAVAAPAFDNPTSMIAISGGAGDPRQSYTRLTMLNFHAGHFASPGQAASVRSHTTLVTVSRVQQFGETGRLHLEISHSTTSIAQPAGNQLHSALNPPFSEQMAVLFQCTGRLPGKANTYGLRFYRNGRAYNNPGNSFATPGTMGSSINIEKQALKNSLQMSLSTTWVESTTMPGEDGWRNLSGSFRIRWKRRAGRQLNLVYQPNISYRMTRGSGSQSSGTNRVSLESSESRRIGKTALNLLTRLSLEQRDYSIYAGPLRAKRILCSSLLNITSGNKNSWLDILYDTGSDGLIPASVNNQFVINAGFHYPIGRQLFCSSSAGYCRVGGEKGHLMLGGTLQARLGDRISINMQCSMATNGTSSNAYSSGGNRVDWSLFYNVKQ